MHSTARRLRGNYEPLESAPSLRPTSRELRASTSWSPMASRFSCSSAIQDTGCTRGRRTHCDQSLAYAETRPEERPRPSPDHGRQVGFTTAVHLAPASSLVKLGA